MRYLNTIVLCCVIIAAVVIVIAAVYHFLRARKWKSIAREKGCSEKEASRFFWLALFRGRDAEKMIIAMPDKTLHEKKENL